MWPSSPPFPCNTPVLQWPAGPHNAPHKGVSCSQWNCMTAKSGAGVNSEVGEGKLPSLFLFYPLSLSLTPLIFSCHWSVLLPGFQIPLRSMPCLQGLLVISSRFPRVDFFLLPVAFSSNRYPPTWSTSNFSRTVKISLRIELSPY